MLYWLTWLFNGGDVFNLFRYITFRAGGAFLTALIFGLPAHPDPPCVARTPRQRPANPQ
jgi:phospho-N-acetylmuramoyl-pentapeptide-transferase